MAAAAASLSYLLLAPKPKAQLDPPPLRSRRRRPGPAISAAASDLLSPAPSLKSCLAAGDTLYGLFLLSFSPTLAELAALSASMGYLWEEQYIVPQVKVISPLETLLN